MTVNAPLSLPDPPSEIRVISPSIHDAPGGMVVLRGVIAPESLAYLLVDESYQRELLSEKKIRRLVIAQRTGTVPDIELGMRGERFCIDDAGDLVLQDHTFIVDGQQRREAGIRFAHEGGVPRIGAAIYVGTHRRWERERFDNINLYQTRLSSNIVVRNLAEDYEVAAAILKLSTLNPKFVLRDRVTWSQRAKRSELITAVMLFKTAGWLHSHQGAGRYTNMQDLIPALEKIYLKVGKHTFINNLMTFYDTIDACFGLRSVYYVEGNAQIKSTFLITLARLFSDHFNYWDGDILSLDRDQLQRLRRFPISDPRVQNLAGAGGSAGEELFTLMVKHLNYKRQERNWLHPRRPYELSGALMPDEVEADEPEESEVSDPDEAEAAETDSA